MAITSIGRSRDGIERRSKQPQEGVAFRRLRNGEDFLELIDRQQESGVAGLPDPQILEEFVDVVDALGRAKPFVPMPPFLRLAEMLGDGLGDGFERRLLGPDRQQLDPLAAPAGDLRQHAGAQQRRLARPGRADDHQQPRAALGAPRVEPLDDGPRLVVAAEIDRGVFGLESMDARVRRPVGIEPEAAGQLAGDRIEPLPQPVEAAGVPVHQIDRLHFRQDKFLAERRTHHRQDHLAERARLRELDPAPGGSEPVRREHQHNGVAARQFLVEPALPVLAGADPAVLVEIEKDLLESEPGKRRLDVVGSLLVEARMADEDGGHWRA